MVEPEIRAAGEAACRSRQGVRRQRGQIQRTRAGGDRVLQEGRQAGLHAGPECLSRLRAEALRREIRQGLAQGCAGAHQCDQVETSKPDNAVPSKAKANPHRWSQGVAAGRWLRRRAENVSALLLLAMFLCFILQIVARYVFNKPLGWTDEVSVLCWIWCTLWGAAFVLREKDEVRFDIIYSGASAQTRRVFTIITGVAAVALFGIALPAVLGDRKSTRLNSSHLG